MTRLVLTEPMCTALTLLLQQGGSSGYCTINRLVGAALCRRGLVEYQTTNPDSWSIQYTCWTLTERGREVAQRLS